MLAKKKSISYPQYIEPNTFSWTCIYEKSQDLTPSILPAKSESLHQYEMNNKVGR